MAERLSLNHANQTRTYVPGEHVWCLPRCLPRILSGSATRSKLASFFLSFLDLLIDEVLARL
jgi:hypothetical protein